MELNGTYTFDAPRELVWEMFLDPEVLARVMPGCESLEEVEEHVFKGKMKIRVGPVQGNFQGTVTLSELSAPNGYHMKVKGRGPAGIVNGEGDLQLAQQNGQTVLTYTGEAKVSGRIASVGQRLMDSSAKSIVKQSLEAFDQQVQARVASEQSAEIGDRRLETGDQPPAASGQPPTATAPAAPSQTQFAMGVAKDVLNDLVQDEQQQLIISGLVILTSVLTIRAIVHWWTDLLARRIAKHIKKEI